MSITGNLKTMQLAELLQWLAQSKKTGTLVIDDSRVTKRIFFSSGRIISSASTDPKEYLGHFLVSHGLITEQELAKAVEMQERTKMLLGKILVTIGAIEEQALHRVLRRKAEESLYDLFTWATGEFRFHDGELPASTMIPIDLDITVVTLEGYRRIDEWKRIREVIPTTQAIPVALTSFDDPKLSQGAQQVLKLVDDNRTIEEICVQTHSSEYFVCRVLFDQLQRRRLKVVKPRWGGSPPATATGADPAAESVVDAQLLITAAVTHMEAGRYETAAPPSARGAQPRAREPQRPGRGRGGGEGDPRPVGEGRRQDDRHPQAGGRPRGPDGVEDHPSGGVHADPDQRLLRPAIDRQDQPHAADGSPARLLAAAAGRAHHAGSEESLRSARPPGGGRDTCGLPRTAKRSGQAAARPA